MRLKKYLNEATITQGTYPVAGDDDHPPGNIVMGNKYKQIPYKNRLTGFNKNWNIDTSEWKWDYFYRCKGMEDPENYSNTLKTLNKYITTFDFFHRLKKKVPDKEVRTDYGRTPRKRDPRVKLGKDDADSAKIPKRRKK